MRRPRTIVRHLPLLVILLCCPLFLVSASSLTFTEHVLQAEYRANSVKIIDLDDDGDVDIVAGGLSYDEVYWYKNDGSETFTKTSIDAAFTDARTVFPIDLDDDGDKDVVATAADSGDQIVWYSNNGSETFTKNTIESSANGPLHLDVADVDDDGDQDLLSNIYTDGDLFWYQNNGSETFTRLTVDSNVSYGNSVDIADLDDDGDKDFVVAGYNVYWYRNNGSETFTKLTANTTSTYVGWAQAIDLDGDGDKDIVATRSNKLFWLVNNGSETFTETVISAEYTGFGEMEAVDFDADGDVDIVVTATDGNGSILLYLNDGNESFTKNVVNDAFYKASYLDVGDIDGDALNDIVSSPSGSWTGDISWFESVADSAPPAPSSFSPASGSTITDATQDITFTTDENATCMVSLTDQAYAAMSVTCTGGGTTSQTCTTPDLGSDGAKSVYIACTDGTNADTVDTNESLSYTLDTSAPTLSSVTAAAGSGSATITWTTSESGSSLVQYGATAALGRSTSEVDTGTGVMSHSVSLSGLTACTHYFYHPVSSDPSRHTATGSTASFTTTGCVNAASVGSQTGSSIATIGGSLSMTGGGSGASVSVPADAAVAAFTLQIKKIDKDTVLAATSTPSGTSVIGDQTYDIRAISGSSLVSTFMQPITVVFSYTDDQVSDYEESSLWIYRWDEAGSAWIDLDDCVVDADANTVSCTTEHFCTLGLFGEAEETGGSTNDSSSTTTSQSAGGRRGSDVGMQQRITTALQNIADRFTQHKGRQEDDIASTTQELHDAGSSPGSAVVQTSDPVVPPKATRNRNRLVATVDDQSVLFRDVPLDAWFTQYVSYVIEEKIAEGYRDEAGKPTGEFGVEQPVTFAEVLKMALEAAGADLKGVPPPRNRSAQDTWASAYVAKAEALQLSVFQPDVDVAQPATRGAVIQTLLEVLGIPTSIKITSPFTDVSSDHRYAQAIATAAAYGIIEGDKDADGNLLHTFRPDDQIIRAEVAKIIALAKEVME
ncbi:MAG: FG-GAP-like repeat-containing protein [Candidatus Peribacteraceae bacterium]